MQAEKSLSLFCLHYFFIGSIIGYIKKTPWKSIISRAFFDSKRKERDSNPRYSSAVQRISSPPRSTTPASFLVV